MTTKYNFQHDINGFFDGALPVSDNMYSATLAANTATALTVPADRGLGGNGITNQVSQWVMVVRFTDAASIWFSNGGTAAVPAGASFGAIASKLLKNGEHIYVKGGDVLSFITVPANIVVSVAFYSIC